MANNNKHSDIETIENDLIRPTGFNRKFYLWMVFLIILLVACIVAYSHQIKNGLSVTGLRDFVSWGMYISNFVFFVAVSLVGMLISCVLGLSGAKWVGPIARISEIIAVAFAMVAGIIIITDMGRPDRLFNLLFHGRIQSPIVWDVIVVITYVILSLLLLCLPMIPDAAILKDNNKFPAWQRKFYKAVSVGWADKPEQFKIIKKSIRILLVVTIPVAFAIHTVTSWLFAATTRIGWDSSIFGPYFVSGAFVAGVACVVIAMYFFRSSFNLKNYIKEDHFNKIGKVFVLVSLVYLYFNINEFLVPAFKMKTGDKVHLLSLFSGHWSGLFWFSILGGLIIPIILLLIKKVRKPLPMLIISIVVLAGAWIKRYLIVIPTMLHPYLPVQNVPEKYTVYKPTIYEGAITLGAFVLVLMIISIISKLFPVITMWEITNKDNETSVNNI